jgi:transcriptional regulator with XRE-family HTH domain
VVKLSELKTAEEVRTDDMQDPEYRREHERTRLANDVAIRVIQYRVRHGLSQAEPARRLGTRQPNVARLESGEHEPTPGAAFDTGLEAITRAPVVDLAAMDEFLCGSWRIAIRAAADPADWQRMHQEAEQLQSGARSAGPTLTEVLGRRGVQR